MSNKQWTYEDRAALFNGPVSTQDLANSLLDARAERDDALRGLKETEKLLALAVGDCEALRERECKVRELALQNYWGGLNVSEGQYGATVVSQQVLAILAQGQKEIPDALPRFHYGLVAEASDGDFETVTREVVWYGWLGESPGNKDFQGCAFADWYDAQTRTSRYPIARATVTFKVPRPKKILSLAERLRAEGMRHGCPIHEDLLEEVCALETKGGK